MQHLIKQLKRKKYRKGKTYLNISFLDRPSAKETEQLFNTPLLLSWMRATDIRIRLLRLNTFGDQYFSNQKSDVLKTYYYAISDLSVGGRCVCNEVCC